MVHILFWSFGILFTFLRLTFLYNVPRKIWQPCTEATWAFVGMGRWGIERGKVGETDNSDSINFTRVLQFSCGSSVFLRNDWKENCSSITMYLHTYVQMFFTCSIPKDIEN
jgi:hypothetical protein